jgi:VanZ family protein
MKKIYSYQTNSPTVKKLLIDKKTGRVVEQGSLRARSKWRIVAAFMVTAAFSILPDLHAERAFGLDYSWWFDMLQHGGYYFVLTFILFSLLPEEKRNFLFFFSIFSVSLGFEFLQLLIPGRTFALLDICSNFLGISLAFLLKRVYEYQKADYAKLKEWHKTHK